LVQTTCFKKDSPRLGFTCQKSFLVMADHFPNPHLWVYSFAQIKLITIIKHIQITNVEWWDNPILDEVIQ